MYLLDACFQLWTVMNKAAINIKNQTNEVVEPEIWGRCQRNPSHSFVHSVSRGVQVQLTLDL